MNCINIICSLKEHKIEKVPQDDIEEQKEDSQDVTQNKKSIIKNSVICVSTLLLIIFMIFISDYLNHYEEHRNFEYVKPDVKSQYDEGLSARIMGHPHHWLKCSDFEYGCCKLTYNYHGYNHTTTLSLYKIVKHDEKGSNCPTLDTIINKYNIHYPMEDVKCSDSKYGCCSVNNHTLNTLSDIYQINCPTIPELITMYENNYESHIGDYIFMFLILCFVIAIMCSKK